LSGILNEIKKELNSDLIKFEKVFAENTRTRVSLLNTIMNYIVRRKGKQIRPLFVLLTARCFGELSEKSYRGASLVELLHTATLVHDDVVDESMKRRGFFSINALWKNKIAVLVGDYLLSRGLLMSVHNKDFELLEIVTDAVKRMSEGELLQLEKARRLDITEEVYFEIIASKTASLFASCCAIGASSMNQSHEIISEMKQFGEFAGIAFQIKDDLLDFGDHDSGKPKGIDIKEKKMTLPLIHALMKASKADRKRIIHIIRKHNTKKEKVDEVVEFIRLSGGVSYAKEQMNYYREQAIKKLTVIENSRHKEMLISLVDFIIERKH
jgi:octaprenyl-diphosphate synthase